MSLTETNATFCDGMDDIELELIQDISDQSLTYKNGVTFKVTASEVVLSYKIAEFTPILDGPVLIHAFK